MARQLQQDDRIRAYALAGARADVEQLTQKLVEIYDLFPELVAERAIDLPELRDQTIDPRRSSRAASTLAPTPKAAPKAKDEALLTVAQAAEIASVTNASIYRWRSIGLLNCHETPEGVRFTRQDLQRAMDATAEARAARGTRISERNRAGGREARTAPEEPAAAPPVEEPAPPPVVAADNLKTCERCGTQFEPKPGSAGRFCKRSCYEDRGNQLPFVAEAPPAETPPAEPEPPVEMPEPMPGRPEPEPEPLTLWEAAAYAKVPYTQIYAWQRRGILASLGSNGHGALYDPRAIDLAKARAAASSMRGNSPFVSSAI